MYDKVKMWWERLQDFADVSGDCWMGLFTLVILIRVLAVLFGKIPLNCNEAAVYSAAIACFAYSNKGPKV
jgi:hypothetical protein